MEAHRQLSDGACYFSAEQDPTALYTNIPQEEARAVAEIFFLRNSPAKNHLHNF